ncbi:uncharacterized protein LOC106462976 isoform X2 [Limulus polyphemus]|uniref:Uncharacterized protein LOC106462976 isoform X2 n=1 Tax=Limulus polyphemus TaxID=6850 RepID=A0ABM1SR33_LIMPO|nr:uncharacterized protein LOC106462976 isoform X2 [Limulus polyphemus]
MDTSNIETERSINKSTSSSSLPLDDEEKEVSKTSPCQTRTVLEKEPERPTRPSPLVENNERARTSDPSTEGKNKSVAHLNSSNFSDISDSDDDFLLAPPEVLISLKHLYTLNEPITPRKEARMKYTKVKNNSPADDKELDNSKVHQYYKKQKCSLSLDKLLKDMEVDAELKAMDEELKRGQVSLEENNEDKVLVQSPSHYGLSVEQFILPEDRISKASPGLSVFSLKQCFQFFSQGKGLTLISCGFKEAEGTNFDKKLMRIPERLLPQIIVSGSFHHQLQFTAFKEPLLLYLFRLLGTHQEVLVQNACKQSLWNLMSFSSFVKTDQFKWCPPLKELTKVFINLGVFASDHCPLRDLFREAEGELRSSVAEQRVVENSDQAAGTDLENSNSDRFLQNLYNVIETLAFLIENWNTYSYEDLINIVQLLCWVSLDPKADGLSVVIERCIAAVLEEIPQSEWCDVVCQLSLKLTEPQGNDSDLVCIYTFQVCQLSLKLTEPQGNDSDLVCIYTFQVCQLSLKLQEPQGNDSDLVCIYTFQVCQL